MKTSKRHIYADTLKIYLKHMAFLKWHVFAALFTSVMGSISEGFKPLLLKYVIDHLNDNAMYYFIFYALNQTAMWSLWRLNTFIVSYVDSRVMRKLVVDGFEKIHQHSQAFFADTFVGSLVKKLNRFEKSYELLTGEVYWQFIPAFMRISQSLITIAFFFPILSVMMFVWAVIYVAFQFKVSFFRSKIEKEKNEADSALSGLAADTFTGAVTIKLFSKNKVETERFDRQAGITEKLRTKSWWIANTAEAIQGFLLIALEAIAISTLIYMYQHGRATVGDFVMIQGLLVLIANRAWDLGRNIRRTMEALEEASEFAEIYYQTPDIGDTPHAKALPLSDASVTLENVGFTYHTNPVFTNFNLSITPGEKVAIVGTSGSGKSTLVKLLLRLYEKQSGVIRIGGREITDVPQDFLRQHISMVPQEPILFHRTLLDNIAYAKPQASRAEVLEAAKLAHAAEFIEKFPDQYETFVGERGVKLSGGERQRVAIARAILADAPILILDEATSSLDSESEMLINDALDTLLDKKTVIAIAHRLSTIMKMDRIIVLESGKIVEEGTHEELLKKHKGTYQKLWNIQAGSYT